MRISNECGSYVSQRWYWQAYFRSASKLFQFSRANNDLRDEASVLNPSIDVVAEGSATLSLWDIRARWHNCNTFVLSISILAFKTTSVRTVRTARILGTLSINGSIATAYLPPFSCFTLQLDASAFLAPF